MCSYIGKVVTVLTGSSERVVTERKIVTSQLALESLLRMYEVR